MGQKERAAPEATEEIINGNLRTISGIIRQYGVNTVLVGGMPLEAIFNHGKVTMVRPNGTVRDMDGLALGPDRENIEACNAAIRKASGRQPLFPPVGLEAVCFGTCPPPDHPWTLLSGIRIDRDRRNFLYYGKVEEEVPAETMQPVPITINGVDFNTLPTTTILWRYYVRSCVIKPKDVAKVNRLRDLIAEHPEGQPDPECYEPYRRFVERVHEKYPGRLWVDHKFWEADYKLGDAFSSSKLLYGVIGLFRKA